MLSSVILSALFFGVDVEAGRRSSKRSGSSQSSSSRGSSRSSKRSGSSQRGSSRSSKRSASSRSSKRSGSSQSSGEIGGSRVTSSSSVEEVAPISTTSNISQSFYDELKSMITELQSKYDALDKRIVALEGKPVTSSTPTSTAITSATKTSSELGYIKGSADLCKPDETGHKYCSVAIDINKKYDNGTYCFAWNFHDSKFWHMNQSLHRITTSTGKNIKAYDFSKNKPSLFAMTDFSYYSDTANVNDTSRLHSGKTVLLCGDAIGPAGKGAANTQIFDGSVGVTYLSNALGSTQPFTHPDGSMVLFNYGDNSPLLRYNMKQNLLEYKPNLSDEYINALRKEFNYEDKEYTEFKYDDIIRLKSIGRYEVILSGAGGGAGGNCLANWGESGGNGGLLKADVLINESDTLSIDLNKNQVVLRNVSIGGAGSGGSKNCGAGSAGGDTYLVVGGTKYIAKGGSGGSGKHGISKSSKASNGGCSQTEGCSVGDGASGGSLGTALKGGNSGSNGSIKFKRKAYYVDIHGKMYKSLDW